MLSDIYNVIDKAFGLLVICNKHQVWKDQEVMKIQGNKRKRIKKRKQLCLGNNGNRKGWSNTGMELFSLLCRQVDIQQKQTDEFEQCIRQTFKEEFNQTRRKGTEEAPNEQTSVIQDTNYYRSHRIDPLLGCNYVKEDTDGENESSDSDGDIH